MADDKNLNLWRHFLSSLQKSKKNFTPKKKKDVFLGSIDCFSTYLSRRLLETSGQSIKTNLSSSALQKNESGANRFIANKEPRSGVKAEEGTENVRRTENTSDVVQKDASSLLPNVPVHSKETSGSTDVTTAVKWIAKTGDNSNPDVSAKKSKVTQDDVSGGAFSASHQAVENKADVPSAACTSELPPGVTSLMQEDVETNRTRKRNVNTKECKAYVDISSSKWTLLMLSEYVDFKQRVGEIDLENRIGGSPDIINKIVSRALEQIKSVRGVVFARSDNIYDLSGIRGTEADIRILLDAVLIPFAEEMELTIETETSYKNNNLPSCTFDYRLRYKNDVVGLVEAKSRLYGNGIGPESVVQGILQLSALQAEVYGRRSQKKSSKKLSPLPFFNIISDGFQFIFMQLDHNKLRFDHQPGGNESGDGMSTLRLYIMDSREHIKNIIERLAKLIFQMKSSIGQTEEEEENEEVEEENEEVEEENEEVEEENEEVEEENEEVEEE